MKLRLIIRSRKESRTVELAGKDHYTVGRTEGDLVLDDTRCSGKHLILREEDNRVVIKDIGSSNGTFLNDTRIQEGSLIRGDRFQIGDTQITLEDHDLDGGNEGLVLNTWPEAFRALPKNKLADFVDYVSEDDKKKSVRLADLAKKKK